MGLLGQVLVADRNDILLHEVVCLVRRLAGHHDAFVEVSDGATKSTKTPQKKEVSRAAGRVRGCAQRNSVETAYLLELSPPVASTIAPCLCIGW